MPAIRMVAIYIYIYIYGHQLYIYIYIYGHHTYSWHVVIAQAHLLQQFPLFFLEQLSALQ